VTHPGLSVSGLFAVLPTPFATDGSLDLASLARLADATLEAGATALTALGFMGEANELDESERDAVARTIRASAVGTPVIVGVSGESHDLIGRRACTAVDLGADGLMISPAADVPLADAVEAAATAGVPIIVQDYPAASGVELEAGDIAEVARQQPLVVGAKVEAPPTSGKIAEIRRLAPNLGVVGGLGGLFLIDELRAGATGVMTGAAVPDRLTGVLRTFPSDPGSAERDWLALLPLLRLEAFAPFNLAARKEVWRQRGVIASAFCRRRGAVLDERAREDIRQALTLV